MARGGKRIGAGRKAGAATKKTRAIAERVATDGGLTMLEIMVGNARYFDQQARDAEAALLQMQPTNLANMEPKEQFDFMLAEVKKAAGLRQLAQDAASDAARFCHPILSPIDPAKRSEDVVPLAERLKAYQRKDAIEQSAGKVVELKKKKTGRAK